MRGRNIDGDRTANANDLDMDGDGLPNAVDPDVDDDGTINIHDPDIDNDNFAFERSPYNSAKVVE